MVGEGIVVYSQHETLTDAIIGALDKKISWVGDINSQGVQD